MDQISPAAWAVIILFALFIIGLNVSLINALRSQTRAKMKMDRTPSQTVEAMRRIGSVLRDPLADERHQFDTLSNLVEKLEDHRPGAPGADAPEHPPAEPQNQAKKL